MPSIWVGLMGAQVLHGGNRYQGRYVEAGSGEPLILLHGQGGHVENFCRNIMPFARHFHVYALDCVWHGSGPQPPFNPELIPTYVDQVLDFMDWKGIESAHFEGQSMGGWTAMHIALEHPERTRKLVLTTAQGFVLHPEPGGKAKPGEEVGGLPGADVLKPFVSFLENPTQENIRLRLERLLARPELLPEEMVDVRRKIYTNPVMNRSLLQVVKQYMGGPGSEPQKHLLTETELARIKAPTLVYWSERNPVPPPAGELLAAAIPGAKHHLVADTGHWAQFENADEHNRVVLRFLTGDDKLELPEESEEAGAAKA